MLSWKHSNWGNRKIDNINSETEPSVYEGYNLKKYYGKFGDSILYCKGVLFDNGDNINYACNPDEQSSCNIFNSYGLYKFLILPTKECVNSCIEDYPYMRNYF